MSKIPLAEGQEKVGAGVVYHGHHGQAVIIMKNYRKTLQIKSCGENFGPVELLGSREGEAIAVGAPAEC